MSDGFGAFDPYSLGGGDPFEPELFGAAEPAAEPAADGLWVDAADGWIDVGAQAWFDGAVDADGDGRADTATVHGGDGLAVFSDLDSDGVADLYHRIHSDGTFETWTYRGDRGWTLLDRGDL